MEMNNMENWSYDDFDKSISSNEEEISRLREANKKLREVKSRKMMTDSLSMITDNGIDFSLADLQAFLQSKKNNAADSQTQEKNKTDSSTEVAETTSSETANVETVVEDKKIETQIPQPDLSRKVEEVEQKNFKVDADEFLNNPPTEEDKEKTSSEFAEELPVVAEVIPVAQENDNPPATEKADDTKENFEDANSQTTPQVNSQQYDLKKIAEYLDMPENATLVEVRQKFNANKNYLIPSIADEYEKILRKFEKE